MHLEHARAPARGARRAGTDRARTHAGLRRRPSPRRPRRRHTRRETARERRRALPSRPARRTAAMQGRRQPRARARCATSGNERPASCAQDTPSNDPALDWARATSRRKKLVRGSLLPSWLEAFVGLLHLLMYALLGAGAGVLIGWVGIGGVV